MTHSKLSLANFSSRTTNHWPILPFKFSLTNFPTWNSGPLTKPHTLIIDKPCDRPHIFRSKFSSPLDRERSDQDRKSLTHGHTRIFHQYWPMNHWPFFLSLAFSPTIGQFFRKPSITIGQLCFIGHFLPIGQLLLRKTSSLANFH